MGTPEMAPVYDIRWSATDRVVDVSYTDVHVDDDASFEAWSQAVGAALSEIRSRVGSKFAMLICIDGLSIAADIAPRYSELAMAVARQYATALVRYGGTAMIGRIVAVEAMRRTIHSEDPLARTKQYAANIFSDRAEGLKFIRLLEAQGLIPSAPSGA